MTVAQTSKDNYFDIRHEKVTARQQKLILKVVKASNKDLTRREIAHHTKLENSSVAGRVNEMMGVVLEEGDKRKCRMSKRMCGTVKVKGK